MNLDIGPYEAGLGFFVKLNKVSETSIDTVFLKIAISTANLISHSYGKFNLKLFTFVSALETLSY